MANKILHRQAGLRDYQIMHPTRDWHIGLAVAVSIFLVGAATSAQLYFSNINTSLEAQVTPEEVIVYRETVVEAALERLVEREETFRQLQGSAVRGAPAPIDTTVATSTPFVDEAVSTGTATSSPTTPAEDVITPAPL